MTGGRPGSLRDVLGVAGGGVTRPRRFGRDWGVTIGVEVLVDGDGVAPLSLPSPELLIGVQGGKFSSNETLRREVFALALVLPLTFFAGGDGEIIPLSASLSSLIITTSGDGTFDFLIADLAGALDTNIEDDLGVEAIRPFTLAGVPPPTDRSCASNEPNFGFLSAVNWEDFESLAFSLFRTFPSGIPEFSGFFLESATSSPRLICWYSFFARHHIRASLYDGGPTTGVITMGKPPRQSAFIARFRSISSMMLKLVFGMSSDDWSASTSCQCRRPVSASSLQ